MTVTGRRPTAQVEAARHHDRRPGPMDLVGAFLALALGAWLAAAAARGGQPVGRALVPWATGVMAYVTARLLARFGGWVVPLGLTIAAATVAVTEWSTLDDRLTGPIGYANATAAFFVVAAFAAAAVATEAPLEPLRIAGGLATPLFAVVPWLNGSRAAALLTLLLIPVAVARGPAVAQWILRGSLVALPLLVLATVVLGVLAGTPREDSSADRLIEATVSSRRLELWGDAVTLTVQHPVLGVGIGGFREESPTARAFPDKGYAHSAFLQVAAETGIPGLALVLALVGWALLRASGPDVTTRVAWPLVAGVAVLLHAGMDYILHYPAVIAGGAAMLGSVALSGAHPDEMTGGGAG